MLDHLLLNAMGVVVSPLMMAIGIDIVLDRKKTDFADKLAGILIIVIFLVMLSYTLFVFKALIVGLSALISLGLGVLSGRLKNGSANQIFALFLFLGSMLLHAFVVRSALF